MTDRIKGLVIVFNEDVPENIAQKIADAISLLPHVAIVEPSVWNNEDLMNRSRIRTELEQQLWAVLRPPKPGSNP